MAEIDSKYLVLIDYGSEGLSINWQTDEWEEAIARYLKPSSEPKLLVQNIDILTILENANPERID